jgi:hypothetical protein
LVLTLDAVGRHDAAVNLLAVTRRHRLESGAYITGIAYPEGVTFPAGETSSYTAAAVILAADALSSSTGAAHLFRHDGIETPLELKEPGCPD